MFKASISQTPLTTEAANSFFTNITGQSFRNDISFLATLRALAAPRIKEGEFINLQFGSTSYSAETVNTNPANAVITAICSSYQLEGCGQVIIHSFSSAQDENLANLRVVSEAFTTRYPGYYKLEKVREFYRKSFMVDCYINPELKNVIVFVDNLDLKKLHYLQVSILAFLPWYFNPKDGVSEQEMELIYSLREPQPEKYIAALSQIAEQYDFRTARIRQLLKGFETRYEQLECENVRQEIARNDRKISQLNEEIGELLGRRSNNCIRLLGLERKIAEGGENSEIMEYFLCNRRLVLEDVTQRDMFFSVKDYLTYFDRDMAEHAINNSKSFVYPNGEEPYRGITPEGMKKLLQEIFVEEIPRLKIKICAAYSFSLNGNVSPMGDYHFPFGFEDCTPNPHINRYRCMGNYQRIINELLQKRDYIGALEQCVASCKSLNWGDSPVMSEFMKVLWGMNREQNNCCIELPESSVVTPAQAIQWLEQQETATRQQEEETNNEQTN